MEGWRVTPVDGEAITYDWQGWTVNATWPQRGRGTDILTLIEVTYQGASTGPRLVWAETRLNIQSTSGKDGLAAAMHRLKTHDRDILHEFLQHVWKDLKYWYRQGTPTLHPQPRQREETGWLIYPVWANTGVTAVAAAPSSFKSWLALALALQLATGTEILTRNTNTPTTPTRVLYLDWEADEATFAERLFALTRGAGLEPESHLAYKSMRVPLADTAGVLQDEIQRGGYGAVVIDSMSASAGGDMIDADIVNHFYDSIRLLGVPALVLAHKSAENIRKKTPRFFGSIMSEARVRLAWNAEKAPTTSTVLWSVFKDNNHGMHDYRLAWDVQIHTEGEREHRRLDYVHIQGVNPEDVRLAANEGDTIHDRAWRALVELGEPSLVGPVAEMIGTTSEALRKVLGRKPDLFKQSGDGRWEAL